MSKKKKIKMALGSRVSRPQKALDTFEAPMGCTHIRLECNEVTSLCPVTGQPDFAKVDILYLPRERCVETKSLKLYLWSFREEGHFAEQLAVIIRDDLMLALDPRFIQIDVRFASRGGIIINAMARSPEPETP